MDNADQLAVVIKAEAVRKGATEATCAALYAVAIGLAVSRDADYWRPINIALMDAFGEAGHRRTKALAWEIHNNAAVALANTREPVSGRGEG